MKKSVSAFMAIVIALVCFFAGCSAKGVEYTEHQNLIKKEIDFSDDVLRFDLKEAGLTDVFVRDKTVTSVLVQEDIFAQVYLIADDRYGGNMGTSDHYLMLVVDDKIILHDLAIGESMSRMGGHIEVQDFDGDGYKEILLQESSGMTGGFGQYVSRVFKYVNGEIKMIFSSYVKDGEYFDTGFSCVVLENYNLRINNRFTGYSEIFNYRNVKSSWYKENEHTDYSSQLLVDSFYDFEAYDVDGDGVYEIVGYQYTSIAGHTDYVGSAKTTLKYDKEKGDFIVSAAEFIRCESKE